MYDTLVLSTDTSIEGSLLPENPSMVNTTYSGYALDMHQNVINPDETQTTITSEENAVFNLQYGFNPKGFSVTNSSDNALQYGFNAEGNIGKSDSGQYIPTLTSPNTPFLGTQTL
jgi:hypothetical protein